MILLPVVLSVVLAACVGTGLVRTPDGRQSPETGTENDTGENVKGAPAPDVEDHGAPEPTGSEPGQPSPDDPEVRAFVTLVNEHRESIGCRSLVVHSVAAAVARAHSRDMVERGYFDHTSPAGEGFSDRLLAAGIEYTFAGENIAEGYATGEGVFESWMDSPAHRENLEQCEFTHHGVGRHQRHWTHLFFVPAEARRRPLPGPAAVHEPVRPDEPVKQPSSS